MSANDQSNALRHELVQQLRREGAIRSDALADAFLSVPRHVFLPGALLDQVYKDVVIPTKFTGPEAISSSSQPTMMAIMLEQGDFRAGQRVLEIGAGTGYNAALMAHLVGEAGEVTTIDLDDDLVAAAREHLQAAGYDRVRVLLGDGWQGDSAGAPYDRIMVTARALDIAPAWFDQLVHRGRLIVPLDIWAGAQYSVAFQRVRDKTYGDCLVSLSSAACGFIPMRGLAGETGLISGESVTRDTQEISISRTAMRDEPDLLTPYESIRLLMGNSWTDIDPMVSATAHSLYGAGFFLWMALRTRAPFAEAYLRPVMLSGRGESRRAIGPLFGRQYNGEDIAQSFGVASPDGLALVVRGTGEKGNRIRLRVRRFGRDDMPAQWLISLLHGWVKAGQPSAEQMQIAAFPSASATMPDHPTVIRKPAFTYLVRWVNRE